MENYEKICDAILDEFDRREIPIEVGLNAIISVLVHTSVHYFDDEQFDEILELIKLQFQESKKLSEREWKPL